MEWKDHDRITVSNNVNLVLYAVRAYASASATTLVTVSARGNTCRGAFAMKDFV
jgi:hypothetical protein